MKKSKKIMLMVIPVLLLVVVVFAGSVFATEPNDTSNGVPTSWPTSGSSITAVDNAAKNVWATLLTIFQILAIAAIVVAGIRYMFASADQKADIKKSLVVLVIGAVLVFGASGVAKLIMSATNQLTDDATTEQ